MPTSDNEVQQIKAIMDDFLCPEHARAVTGRLYDEVGKNTNNESLKTSLLMLKGLYEEK